MAKFAERLLFFVRSGFLVLYALQETARLPAVGIRKKENGTGAASAYKNWSKDMNDCNIRWHYLSWPIMARVARDGSGRLQMKGILAMSGREQEIVSLSLFMEHLQQGGFLQFFDSRDSFRLEAVQVILAKIGASGMDALLAEGADLLRPVLRCRPQGAVILTEAETRRLNGLNATYRRQAEQLYYQAYRYYAR